MAAIKTFFPKPLETPLCLWASNTRIKLARQV
jgi:hypothetical protein